MECKGFEPLCRCINGLMHIHKAEDGGRIVFGIVTLETCDYPEDCAVHVHSMAEPDSGRR